MADILAQLDESFRSFMVKEYAASVGAAPAEGAFVAFQPGGLPLTDQAFKIKPDDPGYSEAKATESVSRKSDLIGNVTGGNFCSILLSLSELVRRAAGSSTFPSAPDGTVELLEHLRAEANRNLDNSLLGSYQVGNLQYNPAFASPEGWYDPAGAPWKSTSFSFSQSTATTEPPPPPEPWTWRVLKPELIPILVERKRFEDLTLAAATLESAEPVSVRIDRLAQIAPEVRARLTPREAAPALTSLLGVAPPAIEVAVAAAPSTRSPKILTARLPTEATEVELVQPQIDLSVLEATYFAIGNETTPTSVESTSISVSFEYQLITLQRPWLPVALLINQYWCLPGYEAGQLVHAATESVQPGIPVAFVALRRLHLAGAWSSRDVEVIPAAQSLGPLSLVGRTVTNQGNQSLTIDCPGLQIVAWICQPLPGLPPSANGAPPPA
jgi:hypothetical protein